MGTSGATPGKKQSYLKEKLSRRTARRLAQCFRPMASDCITGNLRLAGVSSLHFSIVTEASSRMAHVCHPAGRSRTEL